MCKNSMEDIEKDEKMHVSSSIRRNNKPLMEKRRRQRINDCLGQLKTLVLQALKKDTTQYSKLEKADILEMTVKHLKSVQRQQMTAAMATDPNVISKYRAGFNECAAEISRYLDTVHGGSPDLKSRVMNYLSNCMTQFPVVPVYGGQPPMLPQQFFQLPQTGFMSHRSQGPVHLHSSFGHMNQSELSQQTQAALDNLSRHVHISTSGHSSQGPSSSPLRRVSSPSDSDSGLSDDSSSSLGQDENGNYSQVNLLNLNSAHVHGVKSESRSSAMFPMDYRRDTETRCVSNKIRSSPKRSRDSEDEVPESKRRRVSETAESFDVKPPKSVMVPEMAVDNESMWRPW